MILQLGKRPPLPRNIDEILAQEDDLGLLANVQSNAAKAKAAMRSDPVINKFLEIAEFVRENGREPDLSNPAERSLAIRLKTYRETEEHRKKVCEFDEFGLLAPAHSSVPPVVEGQASPEHQPSQPTSLDEIFASDTLGLLDNINFEIFDLKHVHNEAQDEREVPDIIGRQRPCANFDNYRETFEKLYAILSSDAVIKRPFRQESSIRLGQFFQLRGQLCYIAAKLQDGEYNGRDNPRLLVIFDNHTEIEILKLSLARALYADKQSKWLDLAPNLFSGGTVQIQTNGTPAGYIYILETESSASVLAPWKLQRNLVKIGFTTTSVEERLRNAEKDRTYLCAPVKLIYSLECYNLNAHVFEKLIHAFLHDRRLGITMIDNNGKAYHPEEWFTVSAETALEAARHIVDGTINQYRLDSTSGTIKPLAK